MFQAKVFMFSLLGTYESANEKQKTWSRVISEHLAGIYSISVYVLLRATQRLMVWLVLEIFFVYNVQTNWPICLNFFHLKLLNFLPIELLCKQARLLIFSDVILLHVGPITMQSFKNSPWLADTFLFLLLGIPCHFLVVPQAACTTCINVGWLFYVERSTDIILMCKT